MSLAAFAAIIFGSSALFCIIGFIVVFFETYKVLGWRRTDEYDGSDVRKVLDAAPWYSKFFEVLIGPAFYLAVGASIVTVFALIIGA